MSLSKERISYLLKAWSSRKATEAEEQELFDWISDKGDEDAVQAHIKQLVKGYSGNELSPAVEWESLYEQILEKRQPALEPQPNVRAIPWLKWSAAAAILLIIATSGYLLLTPANPDRPTVLAQEDRRNHDIAPPASSKATLSLPNGKIIVLDSTGNGSLAMAGANNASKLNDELVYNANTTATVEWHTLNNPKGSKPIRLQLADGSDVWLNAASSVTFPTFFNGTDRKVTITGEAYFEVAKNTGKKFFVTANGTTTEVLGTHFNINAYENEGVVQVTLLEGAVNVIKADQSARLQPGQQARLADEENIQVVDDINIEEVMAWKNSMFEFNETGIQTIMRQMERWYDIEVVFEDTVTQHFNGSLPRQVNVSKVLDMLEKTGAVRFSIKGKQVLVKKY